MIVYMYGYIRKDSVGSEPWPGSTSLSSHPMPMLKIADGNGAARPENCVEASLETLVPLSTVIVVEHQEYTWVW